MQTLGANVETIGHLGPQRVAVAWTISLNLCRTQKKRTTRVATSTAERSFLPPPSPFPLVLLRSQAKMAQAILAQPVFRQEG